MIQNRNKSNLNFVTAATFSFIVSSLLIMGCGDTPSDPQVVPMGSIEIYAYYDTTWTDTAGVEHDTKLAPWVDYKLDDNPDTMHSDVVPAVLETVFPGIHNIYVEYNDYNTTIIDTVEAGMVSVTEPIMTLFAPDFSLPGIAYDESRTDSLRFLDSLSIYDYLADPQENRYGEVVLLFFFGQT